MNPTITADAEALRAALSEGKPFVYHEQGVPHVAIPNGYKVESLEALLPEPRRIKSLITAHDLTGLIAYTLKFKSEKTQLYAGPVDSPMIEARIDDHLPGAPSRGTHKCAFPCPTTPEWKAWLEKDKKPHGQVEFAEFIENNIRDIVNPAGGELLPAVLNFSDTRKMGFKSAVRLGNGDVNFKYADESGREAGEIAFPERIEIAVKVFEGLNVRYPVEARLRYRIKDEALSMWYELDRPDLTKRQAYSDLLQEVENKVGIQVFRAL